MVFYCQPSSPSLISTPYKIAVAQVLPKWSSQCYWVQRRCVPIKDWVTWCIVSGRHCSPAVGGVFSCGGHLLFGRSPALMGRSDRQHGVRIPRSHGWDSGLHHKQVRWGWWWPYWWGWCFECGTLVLICAFLFREGSLAVTASGDYQVKVFCLQRPDR